MGVDVNNIQRTEHKSLLEFKKDLTSMINWYSLENMESPAGKDGIPDWVIAEVMMDAFKSFALRFHTVMYLRGEYSEKEYLDCGGYDGKCQCWDGEDCPEEKCVDGNEG